MSNPASTASVSKTGSGVEGNDGHLYLKASSDGLSATAYGDNIPASIKDVIIYTDQRGKWLDISWASHAGGEDLTKTLPTVAILTSKDDQPLAFHYRPATGGNTTGRTTLTAGALQATGVGEVRRFIKAHWDEPVDVLVIDTPSSDRDDISEDRTSCHAEMITLATDYSEIKPRHSSVKSVTKLDMMNAAWNEAKKEVESRVTFADQDTFRTKNADIDSLLTSALDCPWSESPGATKPHLTRASP